MYVFIFVYIVLVEGCYLGEFEEFLLEEEGMDVGWLGNISECFRYLALVEWVLMFYFYDEKVFDVSFRKEIIFREWGLFGVGDLRIGEFFF